MDWLQIALDWVEHAWRPRWAEFMSVWHWCFSHGAFRTVMVCIGLFFALSALAALMGPELERAEIRKFNSGSSENRAKAASSVLSAILGAPGSRQAGLRLKVNLSDVILRHVITQLIEQGHVVDGSDGLRLTPTGLGLYHHHHSNKTGGKVHMGDVIKVGSNSHLVSRSVVVNSFSSVESKLRPEARQALGELVQLVLDSGNPEAEENLHGFLAELERPEPRKGVLKSLLSGVASALPSLVSATDLVEKIKSLIVGA